MRATTLLVLLPFAAAGAALAQQSGTAPGSTFDPAPVGGTAVQALGTAGAAVDTGGAAAAAPDAAAAAAPDAAPDAAATAGTAASSTSTVAAEKAPAESETVDQATVGNPDPAATVTATGTAPSGPIELRTIIGDKPIEIPADKATEAFETFRQTGHNPFGGDETAIAAGKKVYAKLCQACHMPDGAGRIGPSLTDDQWRHPRLATEAGRFEIIHSGGAGAMQAFHHRIGIDEILQVMAYTDTFRTRPN